MKYNDVFPGEALHSKNKNRPANSARRHGTWSQVVQLQV